jgi:hypothetical protein
VKEPLSKGVPMSAWARKLPAVAILLAVTIAFAPVATAYAVTAPLGSVRGFVKAAATGTGLSQVKVRVFDMNTAEFIAEAVTDEEGKLNLAELPLGLYQVTVVPPEGYAPAAGPLVHLSDENLEATVDFNLEELPNAPVAQQRRGIPVWAIFTLIGSAAAITAAALTISGAEPDVPVGTR